MILFLIHILLSVLLTYFSYDLINPSFNPWINLLIILGLLIGSIIIVALLAILFFIISFLIAGKRNPKGMFKHHLMVFYSRYFFNIIFRVKVKVIGKENLPKDNNFVIYSNHIEYTDPIYIKQVFNRYPVAFISKESLFKIPIARMVLEGIGCIPISRVADRSALNSIVEGIKTVKNGQPMGIFPEGKRTYSHQMIEFKSGSFKLATKAKATIIPVCLYNMHETLRKGRIGFAKVTIAILPSITEEMYRDMDTTDLSVKVHVMIDQCLTDLQKNQ
ncbi:MAG: hypothetical protein CVV56_00700 [Tenericutes bacterium HGW-Tenericutes-1]|jgi:1-acyl-sn-glycerol-3-phosphate acyltransferase|nr:MAG: hypothetical protein CVV56_00700 [Tenericutes bacterium HGW-Tenericutes-1]